MREVKNQMLGTMVPLFMKLSVIVIFSRQHYSTVFNIYCCESNGCIYDFKCYVYEQNCKSLNVHYLKLTQNKKGI